MEVSCRNCSSVKRLRSSRVSYIYVFPEDCNASAMSNSSATEAGVTKPPTPNKATTNGDAVNEEERKEGVSAIMVAPGSMKKDGKEYKVLYM